MVVRERKDDGKDNGRVGYREVGMKDGYVCMGMDGGGE